MFSLVQQGGNFLICQEKNRVCYKLPLQVPVPPMLPFFVVPPSEVADTVREQLIERSVGIEVHRSTRKVAGEDAHCYAVAGSGPQGQGKVEVCWSRDGILLFYAVDTSDRQGNRSTYTMEAKAGIERSVSDRDLAPPYRVQEFPFPFPTPGR